MTSTDENSPEQVQEHSGAPPLTDNEDEDDDEEEIYLSSDEEEDEEVESLVPDVPNQKVLASLIEGKPSHQKCHECETIPNEECETIAAVAEVTEEEEDKVSTLFVYLDLSTREKELYEEKRDQVDLTPRK